jgi:phosphoserine phosphatase
MSALVALGGAVLFQAAEARALDVMGWSPRNRDVLTRFMAEHGRGGKAYDPAHPPYAVFDWDLTSAYGDCEEATLRYQIWNLRFKLTAEEFRALLKDEINGVEAIGAVKLRDLDADLAAEYALLRERAAAGAPLEEIRATPQFQDFAAKLAFLYEGYCETPGIGAGYGYPWVLFLLAGHTDDELRALARGAIEAGLSDAVRKVTWRSPAGFASRAGPIEFTFRSGLRIHPEIQNLQASLRAAGIDVYVVSASLKEVVEVFAAPGNFGYEVPADHVIGMEVEKKDGRFEPRYKEGWVQTVRQGKVDAIKRTLGARGEPIFGACDSDGDVEMVTAFSGMKLTLIMNRAKGGEIGALCKRAADEAASPAPRYILQGRNENTGLFIPTPESILFGETAPRLLK